MRITAYFSAARPNLTELLVAATWLAALTFVLVGAWALVSAAEMRTERPRLQERLARVEGQIAGVKPHQSLPPESDLQSMRKRVTSLNKLSGMRGWPTPQLLSWLGEQLPDSVYLTSLRHRPREGEAQLVAESRTAEALTGFLLRLEREPGFSEVLLSKQGTRSASGANGVPTPAAVQFEIRLRWKT